LVFYITLPTLMMHGQTQIMYESDLSKIINSY
jgi:hypothetical protein